ncbi:MAG: hypothetical protein AB7N76_29680 [Planctomycetota bacterium]
MRTLYFDIDGTVVSSFGGEAKPLLAAGAFERAVRAAGCARLVCVGNVVAIYRALERIGAAPEPAKLIFDVCRGAFQDLDWLRGALALIEDPAERARFVDTSGDWWWVDDLAELYCGQAGRGALFAAHAGTRILACSPYGDGRDVLDWLETRTARGGVPGEGPHS